MKNLLSISLLGFAISLATPAQAARPMITDDARLTDAGACQMETWVHIHQDEREFWALPACNPGGNFELTLGGALAYTDGQKQHGALLVQGKTLIKPLTTNSYGIGLAASNRGRLTYMFRSVFRWRMTASSFTPTSAICANANPGKTT